MYKTWDRLAKFLTSPVVLFPPVYAMVSALAFALSSGLLAAALPAHQPLIVSRADTNGTNSTTSACTPTNALTPAGTYYGTGNNGTSDVPTRLRISNGGAGLSGLVGALANAFITYKQQNGSASAFKIEWIRGDTTESINYLRTGQADIALTYNKAAECQAMTDNVATRRVYGFRDHFYLAGPPENPAGLKQYTAGSADNEPILTQMQKIVRTGPNDTAVPPTRFLSRYDKSATNIKDSELFIAVGQVPWAYAYSKWYHQYPLYPIDALTAAAKLKEYTITDRGTWLSTDKTYTDMLVRYNEGTDDPDQDDPTKPENPSDPLLNPAFFLIGSQVCQENQALANEFLDWVVSEGGQSVVGNFTGSQPSELLYTRAPTRTDLRIQNCSVTGV